MAEEYVPPKMWKGSSSKRPKLERDVYDDDWDQQQQRLRQQQQQQKQKQKQKQKQQQQQRQEQRDNDYYLISEDEDDGAASILKQVETLELLLLYRVTIIEYFQGRIIHHVAKKEEAEKSLKELQSKLRPSKSVPTTTQDVNSNRLRRPRENGPTESLSFTGPSKKNKSVAGSRETQDLIPSVRTSSVRSCARVHSINYIDGKHSRRLRCLELNPSDGQRFCTSALDGVVNVWELQHDGCIASVLHSSKCSTSKDKWPQDITWHPDGNSIFATYSADGGDSQVSVLNVSTSLNKSVIFLEGKPHKKGMINNIEFMPWNDLSFATGGSDHAVILWHEKDNEKLWEPEMVHWNLHSSAVNGVVGLQQKKMIISVGSDKRIVGFDLQSARFDFKHQIESKCMSILLNPVDLNLFLVQAGTPGKQLKLFDVRLSQKEIHSFGWEQQSSESQSALINQSWSSNGFCISTGSADSMFHIFDIRYTGQNPMESVKAHKKRVFKAAWHRSLPLLVSISSDMHVGLHKII